MSSIGIYLALERIVFLEHSQNMNQERIENLTYEINNLSSTIINSLDGVELREFSSTVSGMQYVIKRVKQAKKQIDDLTWSQALGLARDLNITESLEKQYQDQITNAATKIPYREIFIFQTHDRVEKLKKRLDEQSPGYSCAYYDKTEIPLLQFMIIDGSEVILISDHAKKHLAIKQPHIVHMFSEYYEQIWKNAKVIKYGKNINKTELNKILTNFN